MNKEQQLREVISLNLMCWSNKCQDGDIDADKFTDSIIQSEVVQEMIGGWWISDKLPNDGEIVEIPKTARYKLYKGNSQQFKKGIKGRWQVFNGYGWDNLGYEPRGWVQPLPNPPQAEE